MSNEIRKICPTCGSRTPEIRNSRALMPNRRRFRSSGGRGPYFLYRRGTGPTVPRIRPSRRWALKPPSGRNRTPIVTCADSWHEETPHDVAAALRPWEECRNPDAHAAPSRSVDTRTDRGERRQTKVLRHKERQGKERR
jgi:hypothetical protein